MFNLLPRMVQKSILYVHYSSNSKIYRLNDEDQFPLPNAVFFELRTKCTGRCSFCAASIQNEIRPDTVMEFDLYDKIISDLAGLDYSGRVAFHVNSEPLIVQNLEKYISIAREKLPKSWIQILTNGRSLTLRKAESLMKEKINEISVNHYNDADYQMQAIPERLITIRDEVISKYYPRKNIQCGHGPGNLSEESIFRYNIFLRRETEVLDNRAGNAPNKEIKASENMLGFCELPFNQINITTDGSVGLCCADLYFNNKMGNLKEQSISSIWNGKEFNAVRQALLSNNRKTNSLCVKCDFVGVKGKLFPKLNIF